MTDEDDPKPPEHLQEYDPGSAREAIADNSSTYIKWIADHDAKRRWYFELKERVPVRKKQTVLEDHTKQTDEGTHISSDYYVDMLEYMVVDWSGADDENAPSLRELLTSAYRGNDANNPVFESLWDEVPPPFAEVPEAELNG